MVKGGIGGGNTKTGLHFEGRVDIITFLEKELSVPINIISIGPRRRQTIFRSQNGNDRKTIIK